MKPRMSSASCGSFTSGSASLNVSTNQRSAAGRTTLSRLTTLEATGCPGIQCSGMSDGVEVHLAGLDLNWARIDFLLETARSQHCGLLPGGVQGLSLRPLSGNAGFR